jgi:two-component system nitrate/nitrite response regulator NarL
MTQALDPLTNDPSSNATNSKPSAGPQRSRGDALLTPREAEILQCVAEGASAPTIAEELFISPTTVRAHLRNAYAKLGVCDRAAAVARAMRQGVIS